MIDLGKHYILENAPKSSFFLNSVLRRIIASRADWVYLESNWPGAFGPGAVHRVINNSGGRTMKKSTKVIYNLALVALGLCALIPAAYSAKDDGTKGVICHATGSASNPFVGVVVGIDTSTPLTIFSNNGHLDANGSPLSGHEDDFFLGGSPPFSKTDCPNGPPPTPTPSPTPTP
jgi:hypothetical protein